MDGERIAHLLFRQLHLAERDLRAMRIEAGISQPQVSFAILGIQLEGRFKICSSGRRLMKVLQDVAAVDVGSYYLGIPIQSFAEIFLRLFKLPGLLVNVACQQRNIWLLRQYLIVLWQLTAGVRHIV